MTSELAKKTIALISPVVGDFMATARVRAACNRMNADINVIDRSKLQDFANNIEAVCLNLGPEAAKSIRQKVLNL